jgi:aryl-alcohol dehydrogenase-like predicted oxidoreductase
MVKKQISRKEFVTKALTGMAGIGLISENIGKNLPVGNGSMTMSGLGRSGIQVTPVCFGATRTNEESLIKYALSKGINFLDTGRSYANGNNEKLVGQSVRNIRKDVIIQSKIRLEENEIPSNGKGRKGAAEIRDVLSTKLGESLKALNTSYIDVMLYHDASEEHLLFHPEVLKFFSEKKKEGIIRACGFSTHNDKMNLVERNNSERFYDTIMVPFNHKGSFIHSQTGSYSEWDQAKLIGVLSQAGENGIGVVAMKTCSGGKYSPEPGKEATYTEAVRWVLAHRFISAAAIAMGSFEHIDEFATLLKSI